LRREGILSFTRLTKRGSEQLETEVTSLYDEVMTLTIAIEEAIIKGQKSLGAPNGILECDPVSNQDLAFTCVHRGSSVVGWADDF
jgi:hypothetical protein